MKSNNQLIEAAKLLEYRVNRLNRFLAEGSVPDIILKNELRLISDAYNKVKSAIGGEAVEDGATKE